jgi:cell wall-associated NlpC family hydrolase
MSKRVLGVIATIAIGIPAAGVAVGASVTSAAAAANAPAAVNAPKAASAVSGKAATYVKSLEGAPYVYGGTSTSGFDCSGLTQYVYAHAGTSIPRTAEEQFQDFRRVSRSQAWGGDLVFFHDNSNPDSYVYHVGIYEGGGNMVAASSGAGKVTWESIDWAPSDTITFGTITH